MDKYEWEKFLKKPTKKILHAEWKEAKKHSIHWFACAIGCRLDMPCDTTIESESKIQINTWIKNRLTNNALQLGMDFHEAITCEQKTNAKKIFKEIQGLKRLFKAL